MKRVIKCFLIAITLLLLTACASNSTDKTINSISEVDGNNLGCMSGSIFDELIEEVFPNSEIIYFNSRSELLLGLTTGKIDGFIADEPVAMMMVKENEGVNYLEDGVGKVDYGICFSDNAKQVNIRFNEYLAKIISNGHLKDLQDKWICIDGDEKKKESYTLTGTNGVLRCVTTPDAAPFSFMSNNVFEGFEVELLSEFCYEYGYDLQIDTVSFDAILTSVATNKYDIAFNGIYITEERAKSVNFSNPIYSGKDVVMVRSGVVKNKDFLSGIVDSLYRNFIEEDRYKLLIQGSVVTLTISVFSIVLGTLLGLLLYILSDENKAIKSIIDKVSTILVKLPAVVILMLLFYVVFQTSTISGTIVSIIGFSYMFANTFYGLLKAGVASIDKGQFEAALALGYDKWKAFFNIILPQALKTIHDTYLREVIVLIKNTSIVGYVSVNDITRISDIIRGRTYDALFPLLVVAIIYYFLCTLLVKIIKKPLGHIINKKVRYNDQV